MSDINEEIEEPGKLRVVYPLVINLDKPSKNYKILVKRGDDKSRVVKFTLVKNGVKYNLDGNDVASLRAISENGTIIFADCPVQEDGTCEYTFTETVTSTAGLVTAELSVVTGVGETLSTFEFYIIVEKILYNENDYVSDEDLSGFKEYLAKARAAAVAAEEAQSICEEAVEITAEAVEKADNLLKRTEEAMVKADEAVERAETAAKNIEDAETEVLENMEIVRGYKDDAESARDLAEQYKIDAQMAKVAAETAEVNAKASENYVAAEVPVVLKASADAINAQNAAKNAQNKAEIAQTASEDAQIAAEDAQRAAERARDEAKEIVGIDYATPTTAGIVMIGDGLDVDPTNGRIDVQVDQSLKHKSNKPVSNNAVTVEFDEVYKQLALKAEKTYVDNELAKKADKTYVDDELTKKADKTYVDDELTKKVNQTDFEELQETVSNKANKYTVENRTLYANSWSGDAAPFTYDLGFDDTVDLEVLPSNTIDPTTKEAMDNAQILGNGVDNLLRAWGDKPTVDIPIIVRKVVK